MKINHYYYYYDQVSQQYKLCVLNSLALIGCMVLSTRMIWWRSPPIFPLVKDSVTPAVSHTELRWTELKLKFDAWCFSCAVSKAWSALPSNFHELTILWKTTENSPGYARLWMINRLCRCTSGDFRREWRCEIMYSNLSLTYSLAMY